MHCYRCNADPCTCKDGITLCHGDCREVLPLIGPVGRCVTDPPYGIGFMGKEFDTFKPEVIRAKTADHKAIDHKKQRERSASMHAGSYDVSLSGNQAFQAWCTEWATAMLSALLPGGMLLSFGSPRTFHRLASAVEDAGFEIRDTVMWVYGSGFPKSLDISKAIDKAAGAEREVVGKAGRPSGLHRGKIADYSPSNPDDFEPLITAPATPHAKLWQGYGTALKPAWEPIIVAMKPLDGTFANNAREHGVAGVNVDGGRIPAGQHLTGQRPSDRMMGTERNPLWDKEQKRMSIAVSIADNAMSLTEQGSPRSSAITSAVASLSDEQRKTLFGTSKPDTSCFDGLLEVANTSTSSSTGTSGKKRTAGQSLKAMSSTTRTETAKTIGSKILSLCSGGNTENCTDSSITQKANHSQPERGSNASAAPDGRFPANLLHDGSEEVLGLFPESKSGGGDKHGRKASTFCASTDWESYKGTSNGGDGGSAARFFYCAKASKADRGHLPEESLPLFGETLPEFRNTHPTVKPVELMKYLLTLTAMPTDMGLVDPFAGSGTTGVAAKALGMRCVLIEKEAAYCEIIKTRLE